MDEKYKRISCELYDQLESFAVLNKKLLINYFEEASIIQQEIEIRTLETKNSAEYLITIKGQRIRLDRIISVVEI